MWQPQGFYNEYTLRVPAVLSGVEAVRGLYNYPCSKIAVIHGKNFSDHKTFHSAFAKRDVKFFARSWSGEPDISGLQGTIRSLEEYQPDTVIAVGGGSVIDGCKLCRLFYELPSYEPETTRLEGSMFKTKFIAIPTTPGSGAEISSAAVYLDGKTESKTMIVMHEFIPDVIVYDKRYVMYSPIRLLCASLLDAAAHIIEGYVSSIQNSLIDAIAEKGLAMLVNELRKIIASDSGIASIDYERLQYAGMFGGIVQNHCIVGAAHALAHQTAKSYSHGEAVSLLLPAVIKINSQDKSALDKYNMIASLSGLVDVRELVKFISEVCEYSGIADRKLELRNLLNDLAEGKKFFESVREDRGGKGNPVSMTDDYIRDLIRSI